MICTMMKNKINVAEILANKPQRIKLYSPICGEVVFDKIERDLGHYTILVTTPSQTHYAFMEDGKYERYGECLLFPSKEMHSWEKFAWKKGDVLVSNDFEKEVIFDSFSTSDYSCFKGKHYLNCADDNKYKENMSLFTVNYQIEDKDDTQRFINTIEERLGGKLNMKTLKLENKPKWKFKPFDKVMVRNYDTEVWKANIFSHKAVSIGSHTTIYVCIQGAWNQCIPYNEKTAELIGTTDNWE